MENANGGGFDAFDRDCDVVLEGGVTSGIVYPLALSELARTFRLRSIGGTSSGAIVGAFAAAAEYHRQAQVAAGGSAQGSAADPPPDGRQFAPGFPGLEQFADSLRSGDRLLSVFLPDPETRPIFDVLMAGQREQAAGREARLEGRAARVRPAMHSLLAFLARLPKPLPVALGVAALAATAALAWPAGVRIAALAHQGTTAARVAADLLALGVVVMLLLATAVGAAVGALLAAYRLVTRTWAPAVLRNGFGLTRGLRAPSEAEVEREGADGEEPYALTTWMTRIINELAGRDALDTPLTFGDLWGANPDEHSERGVGFELITTCLTLGRPLRLPEDLDRTPKLYFDPGEWERYFPARVVRQMVCRANGRSRPRDPAAPERGPRYYPLPRPADIPIVVATRLSVAFPFLISATPLWTVDLNTSAGADPDALPLERCWFTDGGVSANFPVHFFDQLIPRWPTFAIDLRPASDAYPLAPPEDEEANVWMPLTNDAGRTELWTRLTCDADPTHRSVATRSLFEFAAAAVSTAVHWRDTTLAIQSGFRDRIAHVKLDPEQEGGLNLAMPPLVIERLTRRGRAAGGLLARRFTVTEDTLARENRKRAARAQARGQTAFRPTTVSWDNHRWIRFRIAMAELQRVLCALDQAYHFDPPYEPLVMRLRGRPPMDFPWSRNQRVGRPDRATDALMRAVADWRRNHPTMEFDDGNGGLPTPRPELRLGPRV